MDVIEVFDFLVSLLMVRLIMIVGFFWIMVVMWVSEGGRVDVVVLIVDWMFNWFFGDVGFLSML